ncbi:MAG: putative photosynthetic complex assembly protein PuhE [Burkholderiaceae bacterium]
MMHAVFTIVFALLVWWLGTSLVLIVGRLASGDGRLGKAICVALYGLSLYGVATTQQLAGVHPAFASFTLAVILWGTLEFSYLRGWLTGPVPLACPPGLSLGKRFVAGIRTSLHHELAVLATVALLLAFSVTAVTQIGLATFVLLWLMRWSAKLNLFLGVRNFNTEMLPANMRYLSTYVRKASMNWLFPVSVVAGGAALYYWVKPLLGWQLTDLAQVESLLLATLMVLALFEHVLLMVPLSDRWLWSWAMAEQNKRMES